MVLSHRSARRHLKKKYSQALKSALSTPFGVNQEDLWLLPPRTSNTKHNNQNVIEYEDGSTPSHQLTHFCRGNRSVRLENLDLSPQSPAWEAARLLFQRP